MVGTLGAAANCQKCQDCQSRKRALNPDIQFRTLRKPNYSLLNAIRSGRKVLVQGVVDSIAMNEFDRFYMRALYDLAYGTAEEGYTWRKKPPISIPGSE